MATLIQFRVGPLSKVQTITLPEGSPYLAGIIDTQGNVVEVLYVGGHDGVNHLMGGGFQVYAGNLANLSAPQGTAIVDTDSNIWVSTGSGWKQAGGGNGAVNLDCGSFWGLLLFFLLAFSSTSYARKMGQADDGSLTPSSALTNRPSCLEERPMADAHSTEQWKPVIYKGVFYRGYEVSDKGRVRSLKKRIHVNGRPKWVISSTPRLLSIWLDAKGYYRVAITQDDKTTPMQVHQLVAEAFIGPPLDGMEVCHGVRGKKDNRLDNISYGTRSKNNKEDKERDGTAFHGEGHPSHKISEKTVLAILRRHRAGEATADLAREYGILYTTAWSIIKRRIWRHLAI